MVLDATGLSAIEEIGWVRPENTTRLNCSGLLCAVNAKVLGGISMNPEDTGGNIRFEVTSSIHDLSRSVLAVRCGKP